MTRIQKWSQYGTFGKLDNYHNIWKFGTTVVVNKKFRFVQGSFQRTTVTVLTPIRANIQMSCAVHVRYRILFIVGGSNHLSTVLVQTNGHADICTCEKDGVLNLQTADSLLVQPRLKSTIHSQSARGGEVELL